jgi:hypothetical protein
MKNLSWQQAEARAKTLIASYKAQDYASLAIRLTSSEPVELSKETISEKPRIIVSSWGQKEPDARLAILVESRKMPPWYGFSQRVSAEGFFIDQSGKIMSMEEKDLWSHGY